jgi:four helix bundle protein
MNAERNRGLEFRTKQFALWIIELFADLPGSAVAQVLGRQVLRSGTSVGAHYREAVRAKSRADFVSKIEGSLQELEETRYWLDLLAASRILSEERVASLMKEAEELTRMLVASARTAKRNKP